MLLVRGPWQERSPKAMVFPWLLDLLSLHQGEISVQEVRLGSHCQLGKPALGSKRQSGIFPSPALSPIMEEQMAKSESLAVVLQRKAFSNNRHQGHTHRFGPELQCSLLLCEGTTCWHLSGFASSQIRERIVLSFASPGVVFFSVDWLPGAP